MRTRRETLLGGLALAACAQTSEISDGASAEERFASIERSVGGRVGVAALNTGTGAWLMHRADERFAMCSTFKWLLAAQMLHLDMHAPGFRNQAVRYNANDLLDYAPVTRARLVGGAGSMTVQELCEAAVVTSDNTAANLLLHAGSGPEGLTRFLRENGDAITRLDRPEPELNENAPGDERDTTSPRAMALTLSRFLVGDTVLNQAARDLLVGWMIASRTGLTRLRAGFPATWRAGDKTGTNDGAHNATNDVAIAWPREGAAPIVIASYLSDNTVSQRARNAAHAEIGRIVATTWG